MAANYNRVIISGVIAATQTWSITPAFGDDTQEGGALTLFSDLQTWADAVAALNGGSVFTGDLSEALSGLASVSKVRVEALTAAGVLLEAAESVLNPATFGGGTASMPSQCSLVATLGTGRPGRSYSGRLYFPNMGVTPQPNTGRLLPATTQTFAENVVDLLNAIASAAPAGTNIHPVVVSHKLQVQTPVTIVSVGDVIDTQRRRRDKLIERYATQPIAAG